ncbi:MAG: tetratricopeptide repeat protein, partial [Gammaproteobacteria bacterium]|nr:tetratricopeptide repeat protein [Gammaproteobacteria bacterium]
YLKQGLHQEMLSAFTFALDLLKKEIKPSPRQPTYSEAVVDLLNPRAPTAFNFYPPLLNYLTMAHHKILLELKNCLKDLKKKHKEAQSIPESDLIAAQYHELQKVVDERERTHHELRDQVSKLYLSLPEAFRAMAFDYVSSQSHAATEAVDRGRPQDAIPMLKEVLELRRKYLAETHRGLIGESAVALGRAYLKINDLRNAEICLCQAKDEFKRVYAHDNPGDDRGAIKAYAREKTKTLGDEVARERSKLVDGVADSLGSLMLELSRTATQTAAVARLDWSAVAPAPAEDVVMRNVEDASTTSAP